MRRKIEPLRLIPDGFGPLLGILLVFARGTRAPCEDAPRPALPRTALLPDAGPHRASRILRLAGVLTGREVRVEDKSLNGETIVIDRRLGRRHVTFEELQLVLAAQKFFVHEWDHPKGRFLVASRRPDWGPPRRAQRATISAPAPRFDEILEFVEKAVARRNDAKPEAAEPVRIVSSPRLGKIWVWGPDVKELEDLVAEVEELQVASDPGERTDRLRMYEARFVRARHLVDPLLESLPERDRERVRLDAPEFANVLIYVAPADVIDRIERELEKLDQPAARKRGTVIDRREEPPPTTDEPPSPEPDPETRTAE